LNGAFGDLVARGAGDIAVEDGDVVRVDAEQFQSGVTVGLSKTAYVLATPRRVGRRHEPHPVSQVEVATSLAPVP
jgi:hypothetical protein